MTMASSAQLTSSMNKPACSSQPAPSAKLKQAYSKVTELEQKFDQQYKLKQATEELLDYNTKESLLSIHIIVC